MLISWLNSNRIRKNKMHWNFFVNSFKLIGDCMHNLVSFNQLSGSYEDEHDARLTEYYECLIECDEQQAVCKRICKEVLL